MKYNMLLFPVLCLASINGFSQNSDPSWGLKLSGYIKNDIFYDTRQSGASNGIREGHFYLYPDNLLPDANGHDLNANPSFHMLSIQSRLRADITAPDALGAKISGVIEAEFFGTAETDINGFRLRHALIKMDWQNSSLVAGQYWHPLFIAESFPGTVSFNTGAPFTPFSRNPQVRITSKIGKISASATAYSQRDFVSSGPDGNSNKYMRNSGLPGLNIQVRVQAGEIFTGWIGADYKNLRPELRTNVNVETNVRLGSFSAFANMKLKTKPVTLSLMGVWGQNASDLVMLGGYAVSEITDTENQFKKYTNINTANAWADITTNGSRLAVGLFAGFSKNLGSREEITGPVYGRGSNIDNLFRISPRITFTEGRLTFAAEIENTSAAYGIMQTNGTVSDTKSVNNTRILLSTILKF